MKALVLTAVRKLEIQEVEQPSITRPDDVLVRIRSCGICGSDLHGYTGQTGRRKPPLIMGHEAAGEVVETGPAVTTLHPGDGVAIQPWVTCGVCPACIDGRHLWCPQRSLMGMNGPGGFAEYLVCPSVNLFPIPPGVSYLHAALTEVSAVALHAVSLVRFRPLQTAAVIGTGTVGLLLLAILRLMGLRKLIAIDTDAGRLRVAQEVGADLVLDASSEDVVRACLQVVGGVGVDHVFEAVGVPATFQNSIALARQGGQAIWIGNNQPYAEIDVQSVVTREITILPSYAFTMVEFGRALDLLATGTIPADRIITRQATLDEGPDLFEELLKRSEIIKSVFHSQDASGPQAT